jgi:lysozyme family protein
MSSARFDLFMPFVLSWEGTTFENDPHDPGGATKFGIDQRSHPSVDIRNLTEAGALAIYWQEWLREGCEFMPALFGECYFDCAVNCGVHRADLIAKISGENWQTFCACRENFYRVLGSGRPRYVRGWLNRVAALRHWCAQHSAGVRVAGDQ